jgi:hypothetical protein
MTKLFAADSSCLDRAKMPRQGCWKSASGRPLGRAEDSGQPWAGGFNKK